MESLYNLARKTIVAGAIALSALLPSVYPQSLPDRNLGGLVERLEMAESNPAEKINIPDKPYGDTRDFLWNKSEIPNGYKLVVYGDLIQKSGKSIVKDDFENPLFMNIGLGLRISKREVTIEDLAAGLYMNTEENRAPTVFLIAVRCFNNKIALETASDYSTILKMAPVSSFGKIPLNKINFILNERNFILLPPEKDNLWYGLFFKNGELIEEIRTAYPKQMLAVEESITKLLARVRAPVKQEEEKNKKGIQDFQKLAEHLRQEEYSLINPEKLKIIKIETEPMPDQLRDFCRKQADWSILSAYTVNKNDVLDFCQRINNKSLKNFYKEGWRLNPKNTKEVFHWKYKDKEVSPFKYRDERIIVERYDRDKEKVVEEMNSSSLIDLVWGLRKSGEYFKLYPEEELKKNKWGMSDIIALSCDFSRAIVTPAWKGLRDDKDIYLIDLTASKISSVLDDTGTSMLTDTISTNSLHFTYDGQYITYNGQYITYPQKDNKELMQRSLAGDESLILLSDMNGKVFELSRKKVEFYKSNKGNMLLDPKIHSKQNSVIERFIILSPTKAIGTVVYSVWNKRHTELIGVQDRENLRDMLDIANPEENIREIEELAYFELGN